MSPALFMSAVVLAAVHGPRPWASSGEDYLYPQEYFSRIDLPSRLEALYLEQTQA